MDEASVQRGLQKALSESSKSTKSRKDAELAPTDSDASSRSGSPDQCCPICLGKFKDKSFSDGCFHRFCFQCILEWAKVKSTCPLCKATFKSIIHNVVSSDVYDQHVLQPSENGSFDTDRHGARFRYHTTLANGRRSAWQTRMDQLLNRQARLAERLQRENEARQRRQLIYAAGLRVHHIATNRFTRFRDTSPHFFRENPAVTHRLIPWLRRDLGVLFNGNSDHVTFMTQYILSLLPNVDIQTEEFHNHLRPFLYGRTEHFIHEFTSFARSPHDMDTYDQMAQYDFRPENPQFTATLRPQQPLIAQNSSSDDSEENNLPINNNNNNNEVILISSDDNDDDAEENVAVRSVSSSQPHNTSQDIPGPSSAADVAGPSTQFDFSSTHNPEPPAIVDHDQPGPSGINSSLQIKQEHNSPAAEAEGEQSEDSSGSVEIVGYQKPFHLRTPIAFITISDDTSTEPEADARGKQGKSKATAQNGVVEEKAGGKRKQKTKHTRNSYSASKASNWSTDSDDSYSGSRHDRHHQRSRDSDERRGGHYSSRYRSRRSFGYHQDKSRSPNELYRKFREEKNKWSLYYETRHDSHSLSQSTSYSRTRGHSSRTLSRSHSRSPSRSRSDTHYHRRYYGDRRYGDYDRQWEHSRESSWQSRDDSYRRRSRSRSRSRERSRESSRYSRDDWHRRRTRSRSRSRSRSGGCNFDPNTDSSRHSSWYKNRYGSTSSSLSRISQQESGLSRSNPTSPHREGPSHLPMSPKRKHEDDPKEPKDGGDRNHSKKHKHKHKHHKKKSSKRKHRRREKDSESKHKGNGKHSKHKSDNGAKPSEDHQQPDVGENASSAESSSECQDGSQVGEDVALGSKLRTVISDGMTSHITLQDLLNMDDNISLGSIQQSEQSDKDSVSNVASSATTELVVLHQGENQIVPPLPKE
ncbi:uncharacterized protein [Diadema setosum]|uniref:uncharacterized protein n=1 Tax=Diadema setosum TaxID=31175 RepID=UPI003B3ADA25